jgi:uncharacterized phage protein (TIGR02218 family)
MISDADGRAVAGLRRQHRRRVVSTPLPATTFGYAAYEQGAVLAEPVECYKFTAGGTVYRYTSADRSVVLAMVDSGTYAPAVVSHDEQVYSQEDASENITVKVPRTNPIAQLFIAYNPPGFVVLSIYRKHRADPEEITIFVGRVLSCNFEGPEAALVCAPISQAFRRRIPSLVVQPQCNWNLYGSGCGVNKLSFKDSGTVIATSGVVVQAAVFGTRPAGWYNNGWLELASAERRYIVSHVGDTVTLQTPFAALAAGTAIDAYAGCDRTEATCASKFANLVNHLGFPRVPTRNPYSGSIT